MKFHGKKNLAEIAVNPRSKFHQGPFGRLFRTLPPYLPPNLNGNSPKLMVLCSRLADFMHESKEQSSDLKFDNPNIPSAYTYLGQFIDHDITFDPVSSLQRQNDPNMLENFRTPRFDLDNIYGEGPDDEPFIYDVNQKGKFLIGKGREIEFGENNVQIQSNKSTKEEDLPRNEQFIALIGDPRNDENIIVAQFQLAFLKFHNCVIDEIKNKFQGDDKQIFQEAQRIVRWHYQWIVINDYLKRLIGEKLLKELLPDVTQDGRKQEYNLSFYEYENEPFMPVEFSVAAYRMGHSMVRAGYSLNVILDGIRTNNDQEKEVPTFLPPSEEPSFLDDLRGVRPLPQSWTLQWNQFLDFKDGANVQNSRLIDSKITNALAKIPAGPPKLGSDGRPVLDSKGNPIQENPLAFLNLLRGFRLELPSGQKVARAMGMSTVLTNEELGLDDFHELGDEAPLWYYVLKESEIVTGGRMLGPVGARIVGEVFIGLAKGDPLCYLNMEPRWKPMVPFAAEDGTFELKDLIKFANMPITEDDINKLLG